MSGLSSFNAGASGPEIGCAVHGVSGAGINMQMLLSFALKCIGPGLANVCRDTFASLVLLLDRPKHSLRIIRNWHPKIYTNLYIYTHIYIYIYIFRFLDSQSLTRY